MKLIKVAVACVNQTPFAWDEGMVVAVGLPVFHEKALYNAAALLADGAIVGFGAKQVPRGRWHPLRAALVQAWPKGELDVLERTAPDGSIRRFPIGDVVFDVGDVRIGFEICEDAWVANRPGARPRAARRRPAPEPSASHLAFGKFPTRQRFVIEGSRAFGVAPAPASCRSSAWPTS